VLEAPIHGRVGWVDGLPVDPTTGTVFTGGDDTTVRVWDLDGDALLGLLGGAVIYQ
jgi:hypothetical protein